MAPAALIWDFDLYDMSDDCMKGCLDDPSLLLYEDKYLLERRLCDDEYDNDHDQTIDDEVDDDLRDECIAALLDDKYRLEPIGHHITRRFYAYTAPPYFKRDHPDDDVFLKQLGDAQLPWRTQLKYPDEPLVKDVVALLIWQDTKDYYFWETLRKMSPPHQDDSLYSHVIREAASLVYFLYTQANLFKIGHERMKEKQMDKIFTQVEQWAKMRTPIDEACKLLVQLTANNDEFSFVTENDLADMLSYYAEDIRTHYYKRPSTIKVIHPPTDKDQLFNDITKVVRKAELSPAQLTVDEYAHWMMTLVREEVSQVEFRLITRPMREHPLVRLAGSSEDRLLSDLFVLLLPLLAEAKERIKRELVNVPQPLFELCNLHKYQICTEISETVQVADLRRMSLGSRFIGRSHLIWALYKLGYALPLEIRDTINVFDSDEDHPPYHIYMAALKLTLCSGEKMMQLDHFVFAVLRSNDIGCDGERVIELYQDFRDFQKALESMENEIEPKSTVTVRPCGALNVFSDSSDDSDGTTDFEPSSSEFEY